MLRRQPFLVFIWATSVVVGASTSAVAAPCVAAEVLDRAKARYPSDSIRSLELTSTLTIHIGERTEEKKFVERYRFPGRAHFEYHGTVSTAVTGDDGKHAWRVTNDGSVPANRKHFAVPMRIRHPGQFLFRVPVSAVECVSGAPPGADRILVTADTGEMVLIDIDQRGHLVRYAGESPDTSPTDTMEVVLSDWRDVDGALVAFRVETHLNGTMRALSETTSARVNPEIPDGVFSPPEVGRPPKGL